MIEDIVAADLNAFEALIRAIQDRLGDNTYGGGASEFFAYQHPSGGLRLRVNPGNFYGGASDPTWIAQQDSSTLTGPVTNPRIDVLVIDNAAGTVSWVAGSEGASPAVPAVSLDKTPLWAVYLRVGATTIDRFGYNTGTNSYVYRDMRPGKYRPVPPFRFPGEISPTSFSATQNDYNPTGLAAATTLRLTATGASRDITGIAGGALDRVLVLHNIGSQNIVLKDANTGSSAANRFAFPSGDVTILPNGMVLLEYDSTSQRWRTTATAAAGGSGISNTEFDAKGDLLVGSANDAFDNLAVGSNNQVLTADSAQTLGVKWATPSGGAMTLITDTVLGADAADITFSSISGSYKTLIIHAQLRGTGSGTDNLLEMQFNADTGSNYDYQYMQGASASITSNKASATTFIRVGDMPFSTAPSGSAAAVRIEIPNYAGTTFWKACLGHTISVTTTTATIEETTGGNWRGTSAITTVKLFPASGNFLAGSRATLWGLA